ncbi:MULTISPECIES: hypothetical protein [unclassified Oscillibacter]|uniref:hypothetical protein n=1 Tax=unclassified Oscillibacter TaxID=2629304 RepID=UPI0025ECE1A9|nr:MULTISPECIES: hypothetical protein [unclassified Oscillibacter]
MKRRFAAAVLALVLMGTLCPPVSAEDSVYFTAVDERVLDLKDSTMPFWFGGYLYVAATVFRESGVNYSYNVVTQTLVLYDSSRSLVFDVSTGSGTTGQGELYDHVCVTRGGVTFVAASPVASYFDRAYSNTPVNHGYLIRVKSAAAVLPDSMFTDTASYQLGAKYQQYQKKNTADPADVSPGETGDPEVEDPASSGKSIYLCFLAEEGEAVTAWLDALESRGVHAAFYFTEEALSRSGDQLRRIAASGSAVGLIPGFGGGAAERLATMNRTLFAEAGIKTRLVYGTAGDAAALRAAGYCPLSPGIDRAQYGLGSSGAANTLLNQIGKRRGPVSVWLGSDVTAGALRVFLASAAEEGDRLPAMTETAF